MAPFPVINPATGEEIARVESDGSGSLGRAFERARAAQPSWQATPLDERLRALARFAELLCARRSELAATLTAEVGKPIAQSRAEIAATAERIAFFLAETPSVLADETVSSSDDVTERISRDPLGVVANISAWNYPYFVGSNVFVPALLAGNAVLYKPSEYATLTGRSIVGLLHEGGVPEDAVIAACGDGRTGEALLELPLDGLFFTGSYATGRAIASRLGTAMIPVQLELGGKDPVYVCDDVDLACAAVSIADGAFYNTGQSCCAVERIYVQQEVFERFVALFSQRVRGFRRGDPGDEATYLGPLTRAPQLDQLEAQVEDAIRRGARVVCGGGRITGPGNFFEPSVLVDVDHSMALMREESFGPVIGIQAVRDDGEALELMADSDYGLTAGVYSRDEVRARDILSRIDAGTVYWNCCDRVSPRLPWAGRGRSGTGTTLSREGIRSFTRPKAWHLRQPAAAS